jgi:hypothetical protein
MLDSSTGQLILDEEKNTLLEDFSLLYVMAPLVRFWIINGSESYHHYLRSMVGRGGAGLETFRRASMHQVWTTQRIP